MNRISCFAFMVVLAASAVACGPADVAGNYTIDITNEANGCNLQNWTVGSSANGVGFDITQNGSAVTGIVQGFVGTEFDLAFGSSTFTGSVSGSGVDMTLMGTHGMTQGSCAYTYNITIVGTLNGDALAGTVTYTAMTNNATDCGSLTNCTSVQNFSGTRPPM